MRTLLALLAFGLLGTVPARAGPIDVVASFTVLADMVREIGGSHVRVRALVGPGGDPHVYEPTPKDSSALARARLVVVSGLGLEGWMNRLVAASGYKGEVVTASKGVPARRMTEDGRELTDPHAWNSAANGVIYARNIAAGLAAADPANAGAYQRSGAAYVAQLEALDAWARREVEGIPAAARRVVTSHRSFGYLGAEYGIEFLAVEGFSTDSEPSAAQVAALIDRIRQERIKVAFLESSSDPRIAEQIAKATGVRLGGTLYAEALSDPGGPAPTYVRMFRYNVGTLVEGMRAN